MIPESRLIRPSTSIAVSEGEILFMGNDLRDFQISGRNNPYGPSDLLSQLELPEDTVIHYCRK